MRQLSSKGVFSKTILVLCVLLKVESAQSDCPTCEFKTNVSTSKILISVGNCIPVNNYTLETQPGYMYTLILNCSTCCNFTTSPGDVSTQSVIIFPGLSPQTEYSINIIIIDANPEINRTETFYTQPDVIRDLNVTNVTTSSVTLSWTKPQGESAFYRVEWEPGSTTNNETTNRTNINITGLIAGTQYTFTVIAVAADRKTEGAPAQLSQYTKPDVIRDLTVTNVTTSSVTLSWTKPQGESAFYRVEWEPGSMTNNETTNKTNINITGLIAGTQYTFTVIAVAADRNTEGASSFWSQYTKPDVIRDLNVTNVTTSSVTLSWNKPQGESAFYRVEWEAGNTTNNETTNKTNINITGLTAGTQYTFTVIAVAADRNTEGAPSFLSQYTKPDFIRDLNVTNVTTSSVTLSWTKPQGESAFYRVEWEAGNKTNNETTNKTNINITGLIAGTQYTFRVIAVAADRKTEGAPTPLSQYTKPDVIRDLHVTNVTTSSVTLSWTKPQGESAFYRVEWEAGNTTNNETTNNTNINITGLIAGTQYTFRVIAVAADRKTEGAPTPLSQYTKPDVIRDLTVTNVTTSSVTLSWTKPQGESAFYRVEWEPGSTTNNETTNRTNINITGLIAGTQYTFTVIAVAADRKTEGAPTPLSQYTNPDVIRDLNVTNVTTSSVTLSWTKPQGESAFYRVEWEAGNKTNNETTNKTNINITGLIAGTQYTFTVIAVAADRKTEGSPSFLSQYTKPDVIRDLSVTNVTTSSVTLSWTKPQGESAFYRVEWEAGNKTNNETTNKTNINITGLIAGTQYTFTVIAVAADRNTEGAPSFLSPYTKPDVIRDLNVTNVTTSSVTLSWTKPQGESAFYRVEWEAGNTTNNETTNKTNINITGLIAGTQYTFRVIAVAADRKTEGAPTPLSQYTKPDVIRDLNVTNVTTSSVTLSWTKPQGESAFYRVEWEAGNTTNNETTNKTNINITGLIAGTQYTFRVIAVAADRKTEGAPTPLSQYTKPDVIRDLHVTNVTTSSVTLSWTKPQGESAFYRVEWEAGNTTNNETTNKTNINITGLTAGTQYTFTVIAVAADRKTEGAPAQLSQYTKPDVIRDLNVTNVTTSSVTLSWTKPQGESAFYRVEWEAGNKTNNETTNRTNINITGLIAGTQYTFTVIAVAADSKTEGLPSFLSQYTNPDVIRDLHVTNVTTSSVTLSWTKPQGESAFYRVEWEAGNMTNNETTNRTNINITGLTAGTQYTFTVIAVAADRKTEGSSSFLSQYTKPGKATNIQTIGTTTTMNVTWDSPAGRVENYNITILENGTLKESKMKNVNVTVPFLNLRPGTIYTVQLSTISGPFIEMSEMVQNATYPNPPGAIQREKQTTDLITISWDRPHDMDLHQYSFIVVYHHQTSQNKTSNNWFILEDLASGTPYDFSVVTEGPMEYQSTEVTAVVSTRPESVRALQVSATTVEAINIKWNKPNGYKEGYSYIVMAWNSSDHILKNESTSNLASGLEGLVPGTKYSFNVTSQTYDKTKGSPMDISKCTDAYPVSDLSWEGPDRTEAMLRLSWNSPKGSNEGFELKWGDTVGQTLPRCTGTCEYNITKLSYHTNYTLSVWTLGCGEKSKVYEAICQTGITDPPQVNINNPITISKKEFNMFVLKFNSTLLNGTNGPIVAYGVLVTSNLNEFSDQSSIPLQDYLVKTYNDWKENSSIPYLATARVIEISRQRSDESEIEVDIGSASEWNGYYNGPLTAKTSYRFAFVMFTHLKLQKDLIVISQSFFSISHFHNNIANLPENPDIILGGAVGGTLAALLVLICVTVFLMIYWRKNAKKETTDIPIQSMRAKVSVPVRVEDYEEYFKKQRADSNCGFAAEYEDLKPVGMFQAKTCAEAQGNRGKNRYSNVLPYDSSRVKLSTQGSPHDDYINANYIPGYNSKKEFIAAQGPLPGTVNEFWRMIWEQNIHTLVMLTKCNEQGRVKCEEYWPFDSKHFDNITVTITSEIPLEDWTIRDFDVKNVKTAETRSVRHFHFTAWPDHGVPETTELLIDFRHLVREHMGQFSQNSPTVVHCSAGVGRTGTLIAIDRLIFQIERDSMVDLFSIVHDLRMHRGLMVQTEDQYVFLHKCAMDIIKSRTGTNVDLIYQNTAALNIYENFEPMKGKVNYPGS